MYIQRNGLFSYLQNIIQKRLSELDKNNYRLIVQFNESCQYGSFQSPALIPNPSERGDIPNIHNTHLHDPR